MRSALSLDHDVAALIEREVETTKRTIKSVINDKLRCVRPGEILGGLLTQVRAQGNIIPDAHLAALAIEQGLELFSTDSDLARYD